MLNKPDVKRMIEDIIRTELARNRADALAVFDYPEDEDLLARLPAEVAETVRQSVSGMFGFPLRAFSSVALMTDYAYASFAANQAVHFFTSGSTGTPKKCVHTTEMMHEEAFGVAPLFKGIKRIISLVPSNHLYGFTFTVLLPHALGAEVKVYPPLPTLSWERILQPGDLMVGFPLFWNYWVRCQIRFPAGVYALSSTAPSKDETIRSLYELGVAGFTEIYGASETGAVAFRHHAGDAFELLPFWELDFSEQPSVKRHSQSVWNVLPDNVELSDARHFRPAGRNDRCVQVAGVNVYPARVEEELRQHPAVQDCKVRLMRPDEGERLKAFIVLNEGFTPEHEAIIRTFLSRRVSVHEMPRRFTFGPALPVNTLGKDADW